jgi:hypothetical protein
VVIGNLMKRYIVDKKDDIRGLLVKKRLIDFPETKDFIVSVIGPRRAGKTYSIYDILLNKRKLQDSEYLFINFEDDVVRTMDRGEIVKAVSYHEEIYGREPGYIFFDEIQGFEGWQNWVYSLYERKRYHVFITGSSSKLLSREIATQLRGRSITIKVFPLSFEEFVGSKGLEVRGYLSTREENKIKNLLQSYLKNGGFPDVAFGNIDAERFFKEYLNLVVFRDVIERFNIRNVFLIRFLLNSMLSSFSKNFSIHKIYNVLKGRGVKVSKKTLYSYSQLLEDVMFSFFLQKFSYSIRESMLSMPKVYVNDTGLVNHVFLLNFEENLGRLMENAVFLELLRETNRIPLLELYYWRDYQQREVDFVLKKGADVRQLIQVTYASGWDEIENREIKSLVKAGEELKCNNLLIITWDYEDAFNVEGKNIKCVPLWKWLLQDYLSPS